MTFIINLVILLFLHALADFTFQTDAMAKGKNRKRNIIEYNKWKENPNSIPIPPGQKYQKTWFYWLSAHALIQGGLIGIMFGNWIIAIIEILSHWIIDFIKCENKTNIHQDQFMHIILRIIYALVI